MEDVGPAQQRTEGEVPPVRPSPDRHSRQIEERVPLCRRLQPFDLILERVIEVAAVHGLFPGHAAVRGASTVDHEHGEPLVGEPLRFEQRPLGTHHPSEVRTPVRIEQHRERLRGLPTRRE